MSIPLNLLHFYIGGPILAYISIHGLFFAKNKNNIVTRYFAWATGIYAIAAFMYCLPVLFTQDSGILTTTTIIGDVVSYVALATVGFLATHLGLARWPWLRRAGNSVIILASLVYVYISYHENLAHPASLTYIDGVAHFDYVSTHIYNVMTGIAFSPLIFVGISFLAQIRGAMRASQRYRIAAFGTFLTQIGLLLAFGPIFNLDLASIFTTISVSVSFIVMSILMFMSFISARKENKVV